MDSGIRVGNMYNLDTDLEDRYKRHLLTLKSLMRKGTIKEVIKELIDEKISSYFANEYLSSVS